MNTWYKINFLIKFSNRENTEDNNSGFTLVGGYQKIVKLDFEKDSLKNKLKNKKIEKITVELEGLSDFQLSVPPEPLHSLEDINKTCSLIEQDYLNKLDLVAARSFICDANDCVGLTSELPPRPSRPSSVDQKPSAVITIKAGDPNFGELSKKILSSMTPTYQATVAATLGGIKLFEMLASLENVFQSAFQHPMLAPGKSSIVFGVTGDGKSTFIGYKNGAQLQLNSDAKGNLAYCYSKGDENTSPHMGRANQTSKTKGYSVYHNMIDTAGFFDRRGKAEELCNKMAIDFVVESLQPGHIIVVLNPAKISDSRGIEFFHLMEKLKQFLWDPSHPNTFSSILFVFNEIIKKPNNELSTKEEIKRDIQNKIEQLEEEIQGDIKQYIGWGDSLKNLAVTASHTVGLGKMMARNLLGEEWTKNKANEIQDIDPDVAAKISENLALQDLLQQLKDSENIIVADFRNDKTRKEIELWEQKAPKLPISAFKLSQAMDNTRLPFFEAMKVIANYFNGQCKKVKNLEDDVLNLKDKIQQTKDMIALIPDSSTTDEDIENYKASKKKEEDEKIIQEGLKAAAEGKIKKLEKEKKELENDNSRKLLQILTPLTPITPRSKWAYFDVVAKKYFFDYKGISLSKTKYIEPTISEKYPGVFLNPQPLKSLQSGKVLGQCTFQATYRPGYYGLTEDQKAVVKLYVENKYHPDTVGRISTIEKDELPKANEAFTTASEEIKKRNGAISSFEIMIQDGKNFLEQQHLKEDYQEMLVGYQMKLSDACKELTDLKSELATYQNFCQLFRDILVNFQQHHMIPSQDDKLADEFIVNFQNKMS